MDRLGVPALSRPCPRTPGLGRDLVNGGCGSILRIMVCESAPER